MKPPNFRTMSVAQLWDLYEQVGQLLTEKLKIEKRELEQRLSKLEGRPKVLPKYQNPDNPSQTWAGRGRTPRWVSEMLNAGRRIDDLLIRETD